jgi:predicted ATP-dependent protease
LSNQQIKKKQKQKLVQKEKKAENKNAQKLMERLDELRKKEKYCDVAVCPKCKSINLRRVKSTMGDMSSHLGLFSCHLRMLRLWMERKDRNLRYQQKAKLERSCTNGRSKRP